MLNQVKMVYICSFRILRLPCSLLLVLQLIILQASVSLSYSNETDREALLDIKNMIHGDPFNVLSSWNKSIYFCSWSGVLCSNALERRVILLNMSSFGLAGSLSPSIGNLSLIREINFQDNNLQGEIAGEIGRLSQLQNLRLANNSFQGSLPASLSNCSSLRIIDLQGNRIQGRIPSELGVLFNLYALNLKRNNFSGIIPPTLGNLSSLQILGLSRNNLTGRIPAEIGKLSKLISLEISVNKLSGPVPNDIYNMSSLQILSITNNQLTGSFPDNIGTTLPKLTSFLADLNYFTGSIPHSLGNASGLTKISIGNNDLTGPIPLHFGRLQQLQTLHFAHNPLGTNKVNDISFLTTLINCTSLQILSLSKIEIGGVLPKSIGNLTSKLRFLWLNDNYISGTIPEEIGNLKSLAFLELRNNSFSGRFPDSIGKLANMQELYISENKFSGEIPFSIGNLTSLEILELAQNTIEGNLPLSLSNCTSLLFLNLSDNHLSGQLPREVLGLPSLTTGLFLDQNQFTGPLPSTIGNMKSLTRLDVSKNHLSGQIPAILGQCEMLLVLLMEGNMFEGNIPPALGQLKGIEVLDLSRNNLSGSIPISLGKLNLIRSINLSFNMLEGEVPVEGIFTNISFLSLQGNEKLCGGIRSLNLIWCPEVSRKHPKLSSKVIIALAISIPLAVILLLACYYAIYRRSQGPTFLASANGYDEHPKISYAELSRITNGFSSENILGEGKYGCVYRGIIQPGEHIIAVKVIKLQQVGAKKSFLAECEVLRVLRHRNLVKIVTACSSIDSAGNDFKALIFEFMPNGSLETWLHSNEQLKLTIDERLRIAIDIAAALDYLHNDCDAPIIHCDIKPSNILLDEDLCAHVSDFGLAMFLSLAEDKSLPSQASSIGIRGTVGYVPPEYGMGGETSTQGDMYSYGILLLELFTGKRPLDNTMTENLSLHFHVKKALPNHVIEVVDPQLSLEKINRLHESRGEGKGSISGIEQCLVTILQTAISCSVEIPRKRMDVKEVLKELHTVKCKLTQILSEEQ